MSKEGWFALAYQQIIQLANWFWFFKNGIDLDAQTYYNQYGSNSDPPRTIYFIIIKCVGVITTATNHQKHTKSNDPNSQ